MSTVDGSLLQIWGKWNIGPMFIYKVSVELWEATVQIIFEISYLSFGIFFCLLMNESPSLIGR